MGRALTRRGYHKDPGIAATPLAGGAAIWNRVRVVAAKRGAMAVVVGCALALGGCTSGLQALFGVRRSLPPPSPPVPAVTADEETLPWAEKEPVIVVVRQSCRTLDVYRYGKRVRSYSAVFGQGGTPKLYEGDRRTPIGLYSITAKYPHPRWNHFLLIDYPSASDRYRHEQAKLTGEVATDANIGGSVGIHGTDKPDKNRRGVDWTWGCVSVDNDAIEDLNRLLPLGTPVVIEN
jgi:murein L,D-transpeptidase YafK